MRRWLVAALVVAAAFLLTSPAFGGPSKTTAKAAEKEFNEEMRKVRPEHLLLPVNYVEYEGESYAYYLPRRFARLARGGESFRIDKIKYKKKHARLRLKSERGAKVTLLVHDNRKLTQDFLDHVLPMAMSELFEFREWTPTPRLVGNTKSWMVHLAACNHLPPQDERQEFESLEESEAQGYRQYPICFSEQEVLPIEGYGPLRAEAVESARLHELAFPPVEDAVAQRALQGLGESILDEYPTELKGFNYSFKILHSELPGARSFSTGFVYVTDKLMSVVEDQAELKHVLAHEIAHCELHRPLSPVHPTGTAPQIEGQISQYYERLRFREIEADLVALLYLSGIQEGSEAVGRARTILQKLQFATESVPSEEPDLYATHPTYASRLAFFDPDHFEMNSLAGAFCGVDKAGEVLARIRVLGKRFHKDRPYLYLLVEASDLLNKTARIQKGLTDKTSVGLLISAGGDRLPLLNPNLPYTLGPGKVRILELKVGYLSGRDNYEKLDVSGLRDVRLEGFDGVKKWVLCEE